MTTEIISYTKKTVANVTLPPGVTVAGWRVLVQDKANPANKQVHDSTVSDTPSFDLPPGTYTVTIEHLDSTGTVIVASAQDFTVAAPPPPPNIVSLEAPDIISVTSVTSAPVPPTSNPFDTLYPTGFKLPLLAAEPIPTLAKPVIKATGLTTPTYLDPAYNTRLYKATDPADYAGATFVRHDYSRRQAFNADNTRFIATTSNGYWLLYDANTFKVLPRTGTNGALKGPAGDCEMIWHPTDPKKLWYTANTGGLVWHEKDVEADTDSVLVDFTARMAALWPKTTQVWTKSEGTSSADGRYWAFMANTYDSVAKANIIYGLFTWDRQTDTILGTLDAAKFNNQFPDHISITPSGKYAVPSWAFQPTLGTRAYPLDFSSSIQLHTQSEHSDLAIGPNGEDYYVVTDYDSGKIRCVNVATGVSFDLMALYPGQGESFAAHISGKAFDRPGWAVIDSYADAANNGGVSPSPTLYPPYRKVMLVELKAGGRQYSVAHTHALANYGGYWGEHQATVSRDGSRILFATNFNDGGVPSDFMIGVPSWVYA